MDKIYKPQEFAKMLNITIRTLQRWDNEYKLVAYRTPTDRRYYTHTQYLKYIGVASDNEEKTGKTIIYTRVSNRGQRDDLVNQVEFLKQYANARGIIVDDVFEDIGSGLNYNRKKWNELIKLCRDGEVKQVFITHKDRLIRFGYDWFEEFFKSCGVEIIVVNNEKSSPQEEMIQDLIR